MKRFWLVVLTLIVATTVFGESKSERVLNPYQDYIIVLIHGLNDYKKSMIGTNEEWSLEQRQARDIRRQLTEELGIPKHHIVAYSYLMNRGSNIENARQLGERGYRPSFPIDGGKNMDAIKKQWTGEQKPYIAFDYNEIIDAYRTEYQAYMPGLDKYFPTGLEPGNSMLEQALKDWKLMFLKSDENPINPLDPTKRLIQTISEIPEANVPKRFIFITHSMGNLSARLYIHSNELAAQGKIFSKGFYQNDVEKVVFLAPPLVGSDLATIAAASPVLSVPMRAVNFISLFFNMIPNVNDPFWPYTYGTYWLNQYMDIKGKMINKPLETYFGLRDAKGDNPAVKDLKTDSEVVTALRDVSKEGGLEPLYSVIYGRGVPLPAQSDLVGLALFGAKTVANNAGAVASGRFGDTGVLGGWIWSRSIHK